MATKTYDPRNVVIKFNGVEFSGYTDGSFVQYAPTRSGLTAAVLALGDGIAAAFLAVEDGSEQASVDIVFNRFLLEGERRMVADRLDEVRPAGVLCRIIELGTPEREALWRLGGLP